MWSKTLCSWFLRRVWKDLELFAKEAVLESYKLSIMNDTGQRLKDYNDDKKPDSKDQAGDISVGNRNPLTFELQAMFLKENLFTFCSGTDTLKDNETKGGRLIKLQEENSSQPNIQSVAWVLFGA